MKHIYFANLLKSAQRSFVVAPFFIALLPVALPSTGSTLLNSSFQARAELSTDSAQERVRVTFETVKNVVRSEKDKLSADELDRKLRAILEPVFDFEEMARSSLGANWRRATPDEQTEFVKLFSELLGRTYLSKIRKSIETASIRFLSSMTKEDRVMVRSVITTDGEDATAEYRMYQRDGEWRIYDLVVENVGLVTNYRNEFAAILRKDDFSGLIAKLKERTLKGPESNEAKEAAK